MDDYIKIRVKKRFKQQLKKEADKVGLTVSSFIRLKLSEILKKNNIL